MFALEASFTKRFGGGAQITIEGLVIPDAPGVTVLFGPSGAGKTTALRCLAGIERPDTGTIRYGAELWLDIRAGSFLRPRERRVGFVPQDYALFPHLKVEQNIGYGLRGMSGAERRKHVQESMEWLGLAGLANRLPGELSAGQQQRVALARAVACRPRLLLLDEPLSALDAPSRLRLRSELRALLLASGLRTLLVTHDRAEALALGDRLAIIEGGALAQQGSIEEVFNRPATLAVAQIVAVETVLPGRVMEISEGLATIVVAGRRLTALAAGLPEGVKEVYACIRAEDVILASDALPHSSPRNCLPGAILRVIPESPMVQVEVDCGFPLRALLTRQASEELGLGAGQRVIALIKAPHIHLIPR